MNSLDFKLRSAITTGLAPAIHPESVASGPSKSGGESSFREILSQSLAARSDVNFSKHAIKRALDHNIELSDDSLERLNRGVRLAEEKNLDDTLILIDQTAFLVNVRNNTVITAVNSRQAQDSVFTNIDGTVIV